MDGISKVVQSIAKTAGALNPENPNDYIGADGLLYCGTCGKQKQCRPFKNNPETVVSCVCDCIKAQMEKILAERILDEKERRRQLCFKTPDAISETGTPQFTVKADISSTFDADDSPESESSKVARGYADQFTDGADWLLFCGTNGIGKSFYSACICNALIDKGYRCRFTSVSEISAELWDAESKQGVITGLAAYDLVVLDDFGAERDTEYMREIQFNVLDSLLRFGRSCIITTNLSAAEIMDPKDAGLKRIYSRIYERSIPVQCKGEDRRKKAMFESASEKLRRLMNGQ